MSNHGFKWELIKMKMRNTTSCYSKTQTYPNKEYENQLHMNCQILKKHYRLFFSEEVKLH